ncbi:C45 family autoproteolytic acyltransferase/hydolase [Anaerovorax odorimutans]|uniref:C45 family autoproteolytic acyltransferase/hydolase n=1 Tax=Anaerovorax odorimutans TaxID=109327 RepID=UPI0004204181|nr:C45 family peptidase [Anaerovorax odorimutans]
MYHGRFKGTHYEVGFKWGKMLLNNKKKLDFCPTFELTEEKYKFANQCLEKYKKYFPEILDEIKGIADGNEIPMKILQTILFCMYCFEFDNKCTCFAFSSNNEIIFGRNSDFLVSLEKLYMNCIYNLTNSYSFNSNTTAYVQMEDGVNEHGLATGLTFVYPKIRKPGLNAGMLIRYILEKCKSTKEAVDEIYRLPIASAQTITIADKKGDIAVIECNPEKIIVIKQKQKEKFVATANNFNSLQMKSYRNPHIDDWRSDDRYQTVYNALKNNEKSYSIEFAQSLLSGKYGFICQYDRSKNADTVWSVVYDLKHKQIWRAEGNPSKKNFKEDTRMNFD